MPSRTHSLTALALGATLAVGACGRSHDSATSSRANGDVAAPATTSYTPVSSAPVDTAPAKHHSKLAGAAAGAAVGHMLGGHAVAGAAAGALLQHERNKHHR